MEIKVGAGNNQHKDPFHVPRSTFHSLLWNWEHGGMDPFTTVHPFGFQKVFFIKVQKKKFPMHVPRSMFHSLIWNWERGGIDPFATIHPFGFQKVFCKNSKRKRIAIYSKARSTFHVPLFNLERRTWRNRSICNHPSFLDFKRVFLKILKEEGLHIIPMHVPRSTLYFGTRTENLEKWIHLYLSIHPYRFQKVY